jgi:hypothetical protein
VTEVWWIYIIVVVVLLFGIYAFLVLIGFEKRFLTRKTSRTVESMYDNYADSDRKQRRYAKEHGGERTDDEADNPPRQTGDTAS